MKLLKLICSIVIILSAIHFDVLAQENGPFTGVDGWIIAGSKPDSYDIGKDEKNIRNQLPSYYLKSISDVKEGFGTIMRDIKSDEYIGKRIRLSGYVRSDSIDNWAGMWMRVDGKIPGKPLSFDNMVNRPIKGTNDWTKYEIVLDVPEISRAIYYGVLINGNGQIWLSDLSIEIVGSDVASTDLMKEPAKIEGWFKAGSRPDLYEIGKSEKITHNQLPSLYLKSISDVKEGFGTIMRDIELDKYIGKRVRLTGYIRSESIDNWAGMWMRVDGRDQEKSLSFDNMQNRPIKGTNDWKKYEIVLDVPENSTGIYYGVLITGNGEVWFPEPAIEVVGSDIPSTNMIK